MYFWDIENGGYVTFIHTSQNIVGCYVYTRGGTVVTNPGGSAIFRQIMSKQTYEVK